MKEFSVKTASATIKNDAARNYPAYIGLDVHKETIAISIAYSGREKPVTRGVIANRSNKVAKLINHLSNELQVHKYARDYFRKEIWQITKWH